MANVLVAVIASVCAALSQTNAAADERNTRFQVDARRAYGYLVQICRIGPRKSDTAGMTEQQRLIAGHFSRLKARSGFFYDLDANVGVEHEGDHITSVD